jgi:phospholipid/cholesterol/gamma-HCH transport system permease protein
MAGAEYAEQYGADGKTELALKGRWTLRSIAAAGTGWRLRLHLLALQRGLRWDCLHIEALDSAGALLLWNLWGRQLPPEVLLRPEHRDIFARLAAMPRENDAPRPAPFAWLESIGAGVLGLLRHLRAFTRLIGQLMLDVAHLLRYPADVPLREISANLYKSGLCAMPITALVGFLIGVVLAYLSALQLRQFGADSFVVNLLGLGIIRELGPVLVAVLVAGRSGSAMTAQLGTMRVTEEIDALAAMGVPRSLRLIFPKVVALAIAVPLLVSWTSFIALLGGMVAANIQLDISYGFFIETLPRAVPVANLWIGLLKGLTFGLVIALCACHFGLRVKPNTESLSVNTTASVVSSITVVLLIDAIYAVLTRSIGLPR